MQEVFNRYSPFAVFRDGTLQPKHIKREREIGLISALPVRDGARERCY
jgi:hypothetical protein